MSKFAPMPKLCDRCVRSVRALASQNARNAVIKICNERHVLAIARVRAGAIASWDLFGPLPEAELAAMLQAMQADVAAQVAQSTAPRH